jgi:thiol-disulfide isomerase/thioredoxin
MKKALLILLLIFQFFSAKGQARDTLLRNSLTTAFYKADSLSDEQHIYDELQQKFPESKSDNRRINYDELKRILALNYIIKGDTNQYYKYIDAINDKVALALFLNNVASHWANSKPLLDKAAQISALSLKLTNQFIKEPARYKPSTLLLPNWIDQLDQQKADVTFTYSTILYKQGQNEQALKYLKPIYQQHKEPKDQIAELYCLLLGTNGTPQKAINAIEETLNTGYVSDVILDELKRDYMLVNGKQANYDNYFTQLQNKVKVKVRARLMKEMISQPAPDFLLKDINGTPVSLKDFRGKVVVIDFWATWCMPCKASFPALQLAVNKYKNNNSVKFLFIDTWENTNEPLPEVKNFITESKYDFNVLLDEKDKAGKQSSIANAFKVTGVPTKFVIDKKGNIRFKDVGYSGSPNQSVEDLSTMIDLSSNN